MSFSLVTSLESPSLFPLDGKALGGGRRDGRIHGSPIDRLNSPNAMVYIWVSLPHRTPKLEAASPVNDIERLGDL